MSAPESIMADKCFVCFLPFLMQGMDLRFEVLVYHSVHGFSGCNRDHQRQDDEQLAELEHADGGQPHSVSRW